MYKILTVKDTVRIPPTKFDKKLKDAVKESLGETMEGDLNPDIGVFLAVTEILDVGEGKIIHDDGAIYYPAEFKVLTFMPEENEMILGEVVDITEFGAFTRIGPIDALIHVSQLMDDKVSYDQKNATFTGKKTGYKLEEGDVVRARVVGVSLGKNKTEVALTTRQPALGSLKWIEKEKKEKEKEEKKGKKGGKKGK